MSQFIDQKLFAALDRLSDEQKEEVLVFLSSFPGAEANDSGMNKWEDDSFVSEMEARYRYYKYGGQMVSAAEADKRIDDLIKRAR